MTPRGATPTPRAVTPRGIAFSTPRGSTPDNLARGATTSRGPTPDNLLPRVPTPDQLLPSRGQTPDLPRVATPQAEPEIDIAPLIRRIQDHVFPRRIRVKEYFVDYDPLKCGRVTRDQFVRAVGLFGARLTAAEVSALVLHCTEMGRQVRGPQDVNYQKLCMTIDEVFVTQRLEKDPGHDVAKPGALLRKGFIPNAVEDQERLEQVLHKVTLLSRTRGINFRTFFQDCDRADSASLIVPRRSGKVSLEQFRRNFPFMKADFSDVDVELLVQRYKTCDGQVHYQALTDDLNNGIVENFDAECPQSPGVLRPGSALWEHDSLSALEKLRSIVCARRVRLRELFFDFDRLRKGKCTFSQMRTVFSILKLDGISEEDFDALYDLYKTEDNMVRYMQMCDDVDEAFTPKGLERDPMAVSKMPDRAATQHARRNKMAVTPSVLQAVEDLQDRLAKLVRQRRPLLRAAFQDHDRVRKGHVTRSQCMRVMHSLGFEMKEAEVALLCKVYCDLGNKQEFNYLDFCAAVDDPHRYADTAATKKFDEHSCRYIAKQSCSASQAVKPSRYFDMEGRIVPLAGSRW